MAINNMCTRRNIIIIEHNNVNSLRYIIMNLWISSPCAVLHTNCMGTIFPNNSYGEPQNLDIGFLS